MNHFLNYFTNVEYNNLQKNNNMYEKALTIVKRVFSSKVDKGGNPYLEHLLFVSDHLYTKEEKIVGLLHDIIEDTEITKTDLQNINFSENIVNEINVITKKSIENYEEYINRIVNNNNLIVLNVK